MKSLHWIPILVLSVLAAPFAWSDELDFYWFRTVHSKNAGKAADFEIRVLETSEVDRSVNTMDEHDCRVVPAAPDEFFCDVNGLKLHLKADAASARAVLETGYRVWAAEIVELRAKGAGVFQARLKSGVIYHVVLAAPSVVDDSMECEITAAFERKVATIIRCRSEFDHSQKFAVKDVPYYREQNGYYHYFGAAPKGENETTDAWRAKNADALAKVKQIVEGRSKLRKWDIRTPLGRETEVFNIGFGLVQGATDLIAFNGSPGVDGFYAATTAPVHLRGSVQHVHRGLEGRSGE